MLKAFAVTMLYSVAIGSLLANKEASVWFVLALALTSIAVIEASYVITLVLNSRAI